MADGDWRVTVTLHAAGHTQRMLERLLEHEAADDVRSKLGERVAVGAGDSSIFLYAGSEAAAREAERVTRDLLADQNLTADLAVHRWHPAEEKWEDPSVPLPQTAAQRDAEHQQVVAGQTRESEETGLAQWEVRVDLPTHREATELAARLRAEGRNVIRRWRFLVIGAANEDEANELARQIGEEAPAGASVHPGSVPRPFVNFGMQEFFQALP